MYTRINILGYKKVSMSGPVWDSCLDFYSDVTSDVIRVELATEGELTLECEREKNVK